MTDDQIKYMANRFLGWRLPADFHPDNGISYQRPNYAPEVDATPVGTNLFTATQAEAMVRHMAEGMPLSTAISDIANERQRQIDLLGWTPEHDDMHDRDNALSRAAACYAVAGLGGSGPFWVTHLQVPQQIWPYRWEWKPKDRRTNLVRAAALIVAEIERLDRATGEP